MFTIRKNGKKYYGYFVVWTLILTAVLTVTAKGQSADKTSPPPTPSDSTALSSAAAAPGPATAPTPPPTTAKGKDTDRLERLLSGKEPLTWVFTGGSITQGGAQTSGWRDYVELFSERLRWELQRNHDIVINTGVSGENLDGLMENVEWRVLRFKPHVVSVMVGMTDSIRGEDNLPHFREQLQQLAEKIHQAGAVLILQTPNAVCRSLSIRRTALPKYVAAIGEAGERNNAIVIDHYNYWIKIKPQENQIIAWLSDDAHPNCFGHRVITAYLLQVLHLYDPQSPTCRLFIP